MGALGLVLLLLLWILIPLGMGLYARKNGLTFRSIFLVSLFFTPIVGIIVFAVDASQKRRTQDEARARVARARAAPKWACLKCGTLNNGAFCSNCGSPRPTADAKPDAGDQSKKELAVETPKESG
jgi:hypothetical protein